MYVDFWNHMYMKYVKLSPDFQENWDKKHMRYWPGILRTNDIIMILIWWNESAVQW